MPGIRAVSLDLFDTLVDLHLDRLPRVPPAPRGDGGADGPARPMPSTSGELHRAVQRHADIALADFVRTLAAVDRELREPRYREGRELPTLERFDRVVQALGIDDPGLPGVLTEIHMRMIREQVSTPPHHGDVLRRLRTRVPVALCSNFSHTPTAERVLREAALDEHFDAVVVSESLGLRKPRREIFEAVASALDVAAAETLHVGDNLRADVAGAAALGMRTVWITRRVPDPQERLRRYDGPPPDAVIADLAELPALLDAS